MNEPEHQREVRGDTLEIRTDKEPVIKRLPEFPKTEELFWTHDFLGEETIGPTLTQLIVWAKLDEPTFSDFIHGAPTVKDDAFTPKFTPKQLKTDYEWEKMDEEFIMDNQILGDSYESSNIYRVSLDIYIDRDSCTIYVQSVTED